jgi:TM2 domain-containing membrane protein YozV
MPPQWYVRTNGTLYGPYGEEDLRQFVDKDRLTPDTDVAETREGPFFPAARIPGLFAGVAPGSHSPSTPAAPAPGKVFCFKCGAQIFAEAEICPQCGVRQQQRPSLLAGFADSPNRVVAAALAFCLGPLGAHKFYLGRIGLGILYLLFGTLLAWLIVPLAIIWTFSVIDGIVYLTYTDEAFADKYSHR